MRARPLNCGDFPNNIFNCVVRDHDVMTVQAMMERPVDLALVGATPWNAPSGLPLDRDHRRNGAWPKGRVPYPRAHSLVSSVV